ncbi:hypothetical protein J8273_4929 [Carpediemonas membranifera]|uniref:Uncharacterized protein n=1 Tax=Carpediemonas membranifera TaxID=201153 RepID=A0A8J6B5R6_9EUKA|nr:hypothetical protein J8273_4929 [Carpediemonas membranifera]|eukprot:KAG9393629.1 hypothetical protein J8273_4929 [Carpediemonas membranifera]
MTWAQGKPHYILWPWPDKKNMCKKMKPETVARLDQLWEDPTRKHKDSEMIKQCRSCSAFFSPGTSSQQLLTHIRKCQGITIVNEFDPNPAFTNMGTGFSTVFPVQPGDPAQFTRYPCDDPELAMMLEPVANDDIDLIRMRLRDLAGREHAITQVLASATNDAAIHNFNAVLNNYYHIMDAIAALTERLESVLASSGSGGIVPMQDLP